MRNPVGLARPQTSLAPTCHRSALPRSQLCVIPVLPQCCAVSSVSTRPPKYRRVSQASAYHRFSQDCRWRGQEYSLAGPGNAHMSARTLKGSPPRLIGLPIASRAWILKSAGLNEYVRTFAIGNKSSKPCHQLYASTSMDAHHAIARGNRLGRRRKASSNRLHEAAVRDRIVAHQHLARQPQCQPSMANGENN